MTALTQPTWISVEEYLAGEEISQIKHEFLGGMVHAMAGASNQHNTISLNILATLHANLRGKPCRPFNSDTKIRITLPDQLRFYYPDAMVVCQPNPPDDHFQDLPVLVIEVLSASTRRTDLGEKLQAYLSIPTVKGLIFVESELFCVAIYRRQSSGGFMREVVEGLEADVVFSEVGVSLPLGEIYAEVKF